MSPPVSPPTTASTQFNIVGADVAHSRGYFGAGETIAQFDTGVDPRSEFGSRLLSGLGYDAIAGAVGDTTDNGNHGTGVAGVLISSASSPIVQGIASSANDLPVRISNADGSITIGDAQLAAATTYVQNQGVKVINNSWGTLTPITGFTQASFGSPLTVAAWRSYVAAGGVEVWATGNGASLQPSIYAAVPQLFPELQAGWVAVASVNATGTISNFSNHCGGAAAWCLVAPGENIQTTLGTGTGAGTGSGTSFATPEVSAAIAMLMSAFPGLSAQQAAAILLQTATKTGIYADQSTYGQGLLNLAAATLPQGTTSITTLGGIKQTVASTQLGLGGAFGAGVNSTASATKVIVRDSYNRPYEISLSSRTVSVAPQLDASYRLGTFGLTDQPDWRLSSPGMHFSGSAESTVAGDLSKSDFRGEIGSYQVRIGFGIDPARAFGPSELLDRNLPKNSSISDPYLGLIDQAWSAAIGQQFGTSKLSLGVATGQPISATQGLLTPAGGRTLAAQQAGSDFAATLEYAETLSDKSTVRFSGGTLHEAGSLLGSTGTGATRLGGADTYHVGMSADWSLTANLMLMAGAHAGYTNSDGRSDSIIAGTSNVVSTAFGLGLVSRNTFAKGDVFSFSLGQPLRASSGSLALNIPGSVTDTGATVRTNTAVGIKADGRETDAQGAWSIPLDGRTSFSAAALVRNQPDNTRNAAPEGVSLFRVNMKL